MVEQRIKDDELFDLFFDGIFLGTHSYTELLKKTEIMEDRDRWLALPNGFGVRHQYGPRATLH